MTSVFSGIALSDFLIVHAAPIEGYGLEDLGVRTIGVGKVAAAANCTELLRANDGVRAVLLFGVAGAFPRAHRDSAPPVAVGELAIVSHDQLGDEGVETPDGFLDLGSMQLSDCGPFVSDPRLAKAAVEQLSAPLVHGVTVSSCSGTDASSQRISARCRADVESMEGAAVGFVCRQYEVPMLQLRAVSNWTGDRDQGEWNLGAAIDVVQAAVRRLMQP